MSSSVPSPGPLAPVYLITGSESLLVERAVEAVVARAQPEIQPASFNASSYRCSDGAADAALADARTPPVMAGRRLVLIKELEQGDDRFYDALDAYLASPSDTTILVLSGAGFPPVRKGGRNQSARIGPKAKAAGQVVKYGDRDAEPVGFAIEHAASLGHRLDRRAAELLVELVGRSLGAVAAEVDKVSLYVGDGAPIGADAVSEACSSVAEAEVWDLTAALAGRDADAAMASLHRLTAQGTAAHQILGLIGWQLRVILKVNEAVLRGRPEAEVAQAAGRMPRARYAALRRAIGPRTPRAAEALETLARANRALNSARAADARVLESLVLALTDA